jgi:hypothetical protein
VGVVAIAFTGFQMMLADWRGYVIAWLAVTAISNLYLAVFAHLRVEISKERTELRQAETRAKKAG